MNILYDLGTWDCSRVATCNSQLSTLIITGSIAIFLQLCAAPWKVMGSNVFAKKIVTALKKAWSRTKKVFWISNLVTRMVSIGFYLSKITSLVSCKNGQMADRKGLRHLFNEIDSKNFAVIALGDLDKDSRPFAPIWLVSSLQLTLAHLVCVARGLERSGGGETAVRRFWSTSFRRAISAAGAGILPRAWRGGKRYNSTVGCCK